MLDANVISGTDVAHESSAFRRAVPTAVSAFLLGALLLTMPWTLLVMTLGEALSKGWLDAPADGRFAGIIDESLNGAWLAAALTLGFLMAIAVATAIVAAKRRLPWLRVASTVIATLLLVFGLTAVAALLT